MRNQLTIYELHFEVKDFEKLLKTGFLNHKSKYMHVEMGKDEIVISFFIPSNEYRFRIFKIIKKYIPDNFFSEIHFHTFTYFEWQYNCEMNKENFQMFINKNIHFSWSADKIENIKAWDRHYMELLEKKKNFENPNVGSIYDSESS